MHTVGYRGEIYDKKKSVSTRPRQDVPENVGHILYGLSGAHRYFTIRVFL